MRGFTLIELLIITAIILLMAGALFPLYANLTASSQLDDAHSGILSVLRTARERSLARLNNYPHGVYFEINAGLEDRYILYQGVSYAARNTNYDRAVTLDSALSISTTVAPGDINFSMGLGRPNATGTVTITHSVKGTREIRINSLGIAE